MYAAKNKHTHTQNRLSAASKSHCIFFCVCVCVFPLQPAAFGSLLPQMCVHMCVFGKETDVRDKRRHRERSISIVSGAASFRRPTGFLRLYLHFSSSLALTNVAICLRNVGKSPHAFFCWGFILKRKSGV